MPAIFTPIRLSLLLMRRQRHFIGWLLTHAILLWYYASHAIDSPFHGDAFISPLAIRLRLMPPRRQTPPLLATPPYAIFSCFQRQRRCRCQPLHGCRH